MLTNAFKINSSLWQGGIPYSGPVLKDEGFTMLILCAQEWQPSEAGYPGLFVVHAPNTDNGQPITQEQLDKAKHAASLAALEIASGGKVLSTCAQGRNRSGLVSALTLYLTQRCSGEEAAQLVRTRYTLPPPGALHNESFNRVLSNLPICTDGDIRRANLENAKCT